MPRIIFDITKSSIDEDQLQVATQWTKTFIHNAPDTAIDMAQLIMACVSKGNFKIRDFMSHTTELHAPSQHLSIADYLSHASRIIIDYNSLSDEYSKELLAYFPEANPSNKVCSRSATRDVKQVRDKVVEGKGFMLGVKGQLPSLIKAPCDFGVNIAMGGDGQNNFNGKKISANGFSGHFYFHRNTKHKLLLAGLEQSAPSSVLGLLAGETQYPEEQQQAHDQFGQGHSLTGASDIYTAAGSLYFSDPIYQAKLLIEKGIFPPAKYGAMQVTLTDDNWPLIKDFLNRLRTNSNSANEDELLKILLEKPSTSGVHEARYTSYIALDFSNYLDQAYKVFIHSSELEDEKKSTVSKMQKKLLSSIKELQFGTLDAFPEFEKLTNHINALDYLPQEYTAALARISKLLSHQLMIDPELKNTQMCRPYQVGDITYNALNDIHHTLNGTNEDDEHSKDYEFGDISWGILNRVNQARGSYQFGDISYAVLGELWRKLNPAEPSGYRFGNITRHLIWGKSTAEKREAPSLDPEQNQNTL